MMVAFITAMIMACTGVYTAPMTVVQNAQDECVLCDDHGEAWCIDYEEGIATGDAVTVIMYDCDTATIQDDIILYVVR